MSKKQKSETEQRQFWDMVFQIFKGSDMSIRKFCKKEGLSEWAFYNWRRKLNNSRKGNSGKTISDNNDEPAFVEISLPNNNPASVELALRSGNTLKINSRTDKKTLSNTLSVLKELSLCWHFPALRGYSYIQSRLICGADLTNSLCLQRV